MHDTLVLKRPHGTTAEVLKSVARRLAGLPPQARKAAAYVLEHPNEIGIASIREMAAAAGVTPNTCVRMARALGFAGYEDFRAPFREEIRHGRGNFPDRARWLQSLSGAGELGGLYADMAASAIANIETTFADCDAERMQAAARTIVAARHTYVLGVGINHTLARNFAYLAGMALDNIDAIPREGGLAIDDIARAGPRDALLAMTFRPWRTDVVEAVEVARREGVTIIGVSDSPASPLVAGSEHGFVVQTDTPQFFTSTFATVALLETLMAFVIAGSSPDIVASVERFHARRQALGMYMQDDE